MSVGLLLVYFPSATFRLCRNSPNLPPNYAIFRVPLSFNKFDIRDYLWNVYKVNALSVRTQVLSGKIKAVPYNRDIFPSELRPSSSRPPVKRLPQKKRAVVEMDKPFIFPEVDKKTAEFWSDQKKQRMDYQLANNRYSQNIIKRPQEIVSISK